MDKDFIKIFEPLLPDEFLEIREFKGKNINSVWISSMEELENYKPDPKVELFIQQYTKGNKTNSKGERDRTGQNSKSIKHLWFDIDNQQNLELVLQDIKGARLPKPSLVVNSGGGFHIYYYLNDRTYKDITPILKSIAPMFKADTKATDIARIMRLEGSHNNKEKYKDNPLVEVVYQNDLSYDLSLFESIADINAKEHLKANTEASIDFESLVSIEFIRECNNKLFKLGVAEGNRNKALGRLTKALEMQNIKPKQAYNHILDWNSRNEPPLPQNELEKYFKAYWNTDYKLNGCVIDTDQLDEKESIKGFKEFLKPFCSKEKCKHYKKQKYMQFEVANSISYKREFIQGAEFKNITGNALILLGILRLHNGLSKDKLRKETKSTIRSLNTFKRALNELLSYDFIDMYTKKGELFCEPLNIKDLVKGYNKIHYHTLEKFIKENHSQNVFKTYLLLTSYINENQDITFMSQNKMAKILGTSQPRVSKNINILAKNNFIIKELVEAKEKKRDEKTGKFITVKRAIYKIFK